MDSDPDFADFPLVLLASAGLEGKERNWSMRQNLLTPQYTTCCNDLPVAVA